MGGQSEQHPSRQPKWSPSERSFLHGIDAEFEFSEVLSEIGRRQLGRPIKFFIGDEGSEVGDAKALGYILPLDKDRRFIIFNNSRCLIIEPREDTSLDEYRSNFAIDDMSPSFDIFQLSEEPRESLDGSIALAIEEFRALARITHTSTSPSDLPKIFEDFELSLRTAEVTKRGWTKAKERVPTGVVDVFKKVFGETITPTPLEPRLRQ